MRTVTTRSLTETSNRAPDSVRVWISDGSPVPFTDLDQLPVSHPTAFGVAARYKGTIDPLVPVGLTTVRAMQADDCFVPEAEWCITFPGGIESYVREPGRVSPETPVRLQGMIEGKWLNRLIGTTEWGPSSLGNNLLAVGPGIITSLGALDQDAEGEIIITYPLPDNGAERRRVQRTSIADLHDQNILDLVRAVLRRCGENGHGIDWIDLSAMGMDAAVVNEPDRLAAAVAGLDDPSMPPTMEWFQRVVARVVQSIVADQLLVVLDSTVTMTVRDGSGVAVGQGELTVAASDSPALRE